MADLNAQLREVCAAHFARKMPGDVPIVNNDGSYRRILLSHGATDTAFQIDLFMVGPNGVHLDASEFDNSPKEFSPGYIVYELPEGQLKFRLAARWNSSEISGEVTTLSPKVTPQLLRQLRESTPFPARRLGYWGVAEKGAAVELILFVFGRANSNQPDEGSSFYHLVSQGRNPQLDWLTHGGERLSLEAFWQAVRRRQLVELKRTFKGQKRQWCPSPPVLVVGTQLFAEFTTWHLEPTLALADLKKLVIIQ